MNYSLILDKKKIIDLSQNAKDIDDIFTLRYIDAITMQCKDEKNLKEYLLKKGLITEEDFSKNICITYGKNKKRYIPILYSTENSEFDNLSALAIEIKNYFNQKKRETYSEFSYELIVGDYTNITSYFDSFSVLARNHNFLYYLQLYASKNPSLAVSINDISVYINQFKGDKKSKFLYIALFEIFRQLFYKFNEETKELEFNYKGFRDFCVFYCDYKRNIKLKKNSSNNNSDIEELDNFIEPDFPPNSEEERKYSEELNNEEFDIENHDHYRR